MRRQRSRVIAVALTMAIPLMLLVAGWGAGLRINMTQSYPLGLWRIIPLDRPLSAGDLIFICPPQTAPFRAALERGYLRRGSCPGWISPLIKTVAALPGQHITVAGSITIDGVPLPHSQIRSQDAGGRELVAWTGGAVPDGHVFLHSEFARSYDSRYLGPIPDAGFLGLARPVFTFAP